MTSDAEFDPATERLLEFSDQVFAEAQASPEGLDPALAAAVRRLKAADELPQMNTDRMRRKKEQFMQGAVAVPVKLNGDGGYRADAGRWRITPSRPSAPTSHNWVRVALVAALILGILTTAMLAGRSWFGGGDGEQPALVPAATLQPATPGDVSMYRADPGRSGVMPGPGPSGSPVELWRFQTGGGIGTAPALVAGMLYNGSDDGNLYALDAASGELAWKFAGAGPMNGSPNVVNNIVYVADDSGVLYALAADSGAELWRFDKSMSGSNPVMVDNQLLVAGSDNAVYALDLATGAENWSLNIGTSLQRGVAFEGNFLFAVTADGVVHAINVESQTEEWQVQIAPGVRLLTPAAVDGRLFIAADLADEGSITVLEAASGEQIWQFDTLLGAFPPAVGNTLVFVPSPNGTLFALDIATGEEVWRLVTPARVLAAPALVDDTVYVGGYDGNLYALDASNGKEIWKFAAGGEIDFGPIVSGGVVYFGALNGIVYALGDAPAAGVTPDDGAATAVAAMAFDPQAIALNWETRGREDSPFLFVQSVAAAPDGRVYVANGRLDRIDIFAPDGSFLESWGESGTGPGQFRFTEPEGDGADIAFDAAGNIYVFDTSNHRIQKFAPDHTFLMEWGGEGVENGAFLHPFGTVDSVNGRVYVADLGNSRVQVFDLEGNFLDKWGTFGTAEGQFVAPSEVAVDSEGNVYVSSDAAARVQKFDPSGRFLASIGSDLQLNSIIGLAVDASDNLFAASQGAGEIYVFAPEGRHIGTIEEIPGHGPLVSPYYMNFGPDGTLFMLEGTGSDSLLNVQLPPIDLEE